MILFFALHFTHVVQYGRSKKKINYLKASPFLCAIEIILRECANSLELKESSSGNSIQKLQWLRYGTLESRIFSGESAVHRQFVRRCSHKACTCTCILLCGKLQCLYKKKKKTQKRGHTRLQYSEYSPYLVRFLSLTLIHECPNVQYSIRFRGRSCWLCEACRKIFVGGDLRFFASSAIAVFLWWKFLTTPVCALFSSRQLARFSMTSRSGLLSFLPRDWQSVWHLVKWKLFQFWVILFFVETTLCSIFIARKFLYKGFLMQKTFFFFF